MSRPGERGSISGSSALEADRLVGPVVKASASREGFNSRLRSGDLSGSSHTNDLMIGHPKAAPPGAWRCRVRAGTGQPGVSILLPG